jgi:hypothetical protein
MPPETSGIPWRIIGSALGGLIGYGVLHFNVGQKTLWNLLGYGIASGLLPAVCTVTLFGLAFNRFRLKRLIENTPTSRIRSLAMGLVEVHGYARRKYSLVAPMSQTPCVWYRVRCYRRQGDNWRLISDNNSGHVPFLLEDATGRVTIDPARAMIRAGSRSESGGAAASLSFLVNDASVSDEKWIEEKIAEGEALYVLGSANVIKGTGKTLHERKLERLRELKTDRNALHAYDSDGDGQISEQEWQTARESVEDQVAREHLAEKLMAQKTEETTVIGRSAYRTHPFVVAATRSEAHLTRNYTLISSLQFAGGLIFFIWTLVAVFRYFGMR